MRGYGYGYRMGRKRKKLADKQAALAKLTAREREALGV